MPCLYVYHFMPFEEAKLKDNVDKIKIITAKKQAYLNIFSSYIYPKIVNKYILFDIRNRPTKISIIPATMFTYFKATDAF